MAYALRLARLTVGSKNVLFPSFVIRSLQPMVTSSVNMKQKEDFWEKNKRLDRPLSPHLSIYKYQITSVMSVTHRATGIVLAGGLYGLSLGMLLLPSNFPHYMCLLQSLHIGPLIFLTKWGLGTAFSYHLLNGIRHLAWDLGYGFELSDLYKSGYAVLASSLILGTLAAFM